MLGGDHSVAWPVVAALGAARHRAVGDRSRRRAHGSAARAAGRAPLLRDLGVPRQRAARAGRAAGAGGRARVVAVEAALGVDAGRAAVLGGRGARARRRGDRRRDRAPARAGRRARLPVERHRRDRQRDRAVDRRAGGERPRARVRRHVDRARRRGVSAAGRRRRRGGAVDRQRRGRAAHDGRGRRVYAGDAGGDDERARAARDSGQAKATMPRPPEDEITQQAARIRAIRAAWDAFEAGKLETARRRAERLGEGSPEGLVPARGVLPRGGRRRRARSRC